jgi:hypothetical protein
MFLDCRKLELGKVNLPRKGETVVTLFSRVGEGWS